VEVDKAITCPTKCIISPTPHLVITSEKGARFVGYQVCDGMSCKQDKLDNSLYVHLAVVPQNYSGTVGFEASPINLGNLPWSVGDTVHILVQAFPVTLEPNNAVTKEPDKIQVVDLGESMIIGTVNSTNVSTLVIPDGSDDPTYGKNFEPGYLVVVLGINNTVQWINHGDMTNRIVVDGQNIPGFSGTTSTLANVQGMTSQPIFLKPGESFNFTFTQAGEFGYHAEPHSWLHGWVLVLPQSTENATQTVVVNDTKIPGPCEIFTLPCPMGPHIFTVQKFGSDIYIEKMTINGIDKYVVVRPPSYCVYPPSYRGYETCRNPDDLAILRLVGVDTSIPQENLSITITGLESSYVAGQPVDFGITVKGYGHCDFPSVLVIHEGNIVWKSRSAEISCPYPVQTIVDKYGMMDLGGPLYLNQTGTYTVHVGYASNMTEKQFNVTSLESASQTNRTTYTKNNDPFGIVALVIYRSPLACLGPCPPNNFYLKINSNSTAYLLGYNICDGDFCTSRHDLSVLLPIKDVLRPDFAMIGLPVDLKWKYGDTIKIQLEVSHVSDIKTALLIDYGNSTIVP
jgi:plastocyanin